MQEVLIFKGADRANAVSIFAKKWLLCKTRWYINAHEYNERNCWPPLPDDEVVEIMNKAQTDLNTFVSEARNEGRLKWEGRSMVIVDRNGKKTRKDGTI